MLPGWGPLGPLRPLHPSCTRSVGILGLGPLCFLFFVFPSRPLPLTPPGRPLNGRSKTLGQEHHRRTVESSTSPDHQEHTQQHSSQQSTHEYLRGECVGAVHSSSPVPPCPQHPYQHPFFLRSPASRGRIPPIPRPLHPTHCGRRARA